MATKGPQLNPSPKCMDFCELLLQVTQKQKGPKADSLRFKQIVRQTMSLGDTYNDSITDVLGNHVMVKPLNVTIYSLYFTHFHIFIPLEKIHQKYDALCYLQCVCVWGGVRCFCSQSRGRSDCTAVQSGQFFYYWLPSLRSVSHYSKLWKEFTTKTFFTQLSQPTNS